MPQWGLIADYRARIGRKRHYGARHDEVQGPNARTIMRLASDVFAKHQVREIYRIRDRRKAPNLHLQWGPILAFSDTQLHQSDTPAWRQFGVASYC